MLGDANRLLFIDDWGDWEEGPSLCLLRYAQDDNSQNDPLPFRVANGQNPSKMLLFSIDVNELPVRIFFMGPFPSACGEKPAGVLLARSLGRGRLIKQ